MRGDFFLRISHATKCGIERVFTHGTLGAARRREDISFAAEHLGQVCEIASNLLGQRDGMRSARFHFTGRDLPDPIDEVDLMPFGVAEFAGAYEHMRRDLQSKLGHHVASEVVDCAQQPA